MQILVDEAHIRIISKDRKSAQRKMMRGLHSRLRNDTDGKIKGRTKEHRTVIIIVFCP